MFGRDLELERVDVVLERACSGPAGLLVEGGPGIGKSTVWRDAVARAQVREWLVLEAAPSEPDAALAFSGLGDLFDRLPDGVVAGLPEPQRRALEAALFRVDASQAPFDRQALPRAVLNVLRALAVDGVVVAVDDEQWLDHASARALSFALTRVREERVCLLLARRAASAGQLWGELSRGFTGLEVLELGPLGFEAIRRLVGTVLGATLERRLVARIFEVSGGNPLYALAIARELARSSPNGDREIRLPASLSEAIGRRLRRLPARAQAPLLVVAAAANPTLELLAAAVDGFKEGDLDAAVQAGVLEGDGGSVAFTHPLLASVHYESAAAEQRRGVHRRLAAVLSDPEERAVHLALASSAPDEQVALVLAKAAALAARRGAPEAAADLLAHAARLTPAEMERSRWERTIDAAEQHFAAGAGRRSRALLEQLLEGGLSGPTRARALMALAQGRSDDFDASRALFAQALSEAGDDHRLRARIEILFCDYSTNFVDYLAMLEHAQAAVQAAELAGDATLLASALAILGSSISARGGDPSEVFRRAVELEDPDDEMTRTSFLPSVCYANSLRANDDLVPARPLLEHAEQRARRRGEELDRFIMLVRLTDLTWRAGDTLAAGRYLAQAATAASEQANPELDSWVADMESVQAADRGEIDFARQKALEALAIANENRDGSMALMTGAILAKIELWAGDPDAAHARLKPLRDWVLQHGPWYLGWRMLTLWSCDIEALIATGKLDDAAVVLDDLRRRAAASGNPHAIALAKRCEGLLLAALGDITAAIEAMHSALEHHAQRPQPFELARTLLEKGTLERRAKHKTAANATLHEALDTFQRLGAELWAQRARDEISRVGLRRRASRDGLTPAEDRVAELAVAGKSNVEIAQALFMSQRTVEAHLTSIYRAFGVRSRTQLAVTMPATKTGSEPGTPDTHL